MFNVGDKVVYPQHGAGTIEAIEEKNMFGTKEEYFVIKMQGDIKVMVPKKNALNVGMREIVDMPTASKAFGVLEQPKQAYVYENNWNRRYKANVDKIKTGDICEVADVVRDLSHRHMERGLSTGEKKMLLTAKQILSSELVLSNDMNAQQIDDIIEEKVKFSFDLGNDAEIKETL
ncbi:MAG: CarD family transcriptional regulator [Clostridia bacterium]